MGTKSPLQKEALLAELASTRAGILEMGKRLPARVRERAFLGIWSIRDLIAHLTGWDLANLAAAKAVLRGRLPAFYAYHDRDWQTYNARLVRKHNRGTFGQLLRAARASHAQLLDFLARSPAEAFDRDTGVRFKGFRVTIARLLEAELSDERAHGRQVSAFLRSLRSARE